jgi:hypothetical protein
VYLSIGQWARNQMQVVADPKTGRMMVEVQELMSDVYRPGEEQKHDGGNMTGSERYGTGSETDETLGSKVDASENTSIGK